MLKSSGFLRQCLAVLFISYTSIVTAVPASVFIHTDNGSPQFVFALNVAADTNDLYFHMSGPSSNSYVAVGTGTVMAGSMEFVVYANSDGNGITVSARLADSHNEPTYSSKINLSLLDGSGIFNNNYVVNARCQNCTSWSRGSLNLHSTTQDWNWAIGPNNGFKSNDQAATIQCHTMYGRFKMDMTQATGAGGLPTDYSINTGAEDDGTATSVDFAALIHAVVASAAFCLLMPLGVVYLKGMGSVRYHWVAQAIATLLALIGGGGMGIYLSSTYNDTKSYNNSHQILGLVVMAGIMIQLGLGWYHHVIYKRTGSGTRYGPIHRYFGYIIMALGIIDGAIGLPLASNSKYLAAYIPIAIVCLLLAAGVIYLQQRRRTKSHTAIDDTYEYEAPLSRESWPTQNIDNNIPMSPRTRSSGPSLPRRQ